MFYFFLNPTLLLNIPLVIAAIVPAALLMWIVYRTDRLEKESWRLLRALIVAGILSSLIAMVEEWIGEMILAAVVTDETLGNIILFFVIVGLAEESSKYLMLKRRTWKNPEFNCQYDGVVYAVFVSLGFALWENINYVISYGMVTAVVRAVTAVPGHACFGVFMGVFYGMARRAFLLGRTRESKHYRILAIVVPMLLHGTYDYIAVVAAEVSGWYFIGFVAVMFAISVVLIRRMAKNDRYLNQGYGGMQQW